MLGKWIVGESGSKKIEACAAIFFPLCVKRLGEGFSIDDFAPWMASPKFAKDSTRQNFPTWDTSLKFNPNRELLRAQQIFLHMAIDDPDVNISTRMRVFEDICDQPESLEVYRRALNLVSSWTLWQQSLFQIMVKSVVPVWVPTKGRQDGNSFTDPDFLGAIFTSIDPRSPYPELTLNITFAHELGHLCLMLYQYSTDLFFGAKKEVYSGVRKTNRPVVSAFHAAVALGYMITAANSLLLTVPASDVSRTAFLSALLVDYTENLERSLREIEPVEKTKLCEDIMRDLWKILS